MNAHRLKNTKGSKTKFGVKQSDVKKFSAPRTESKTAQPNSSKTITSKKLSIRSD